MIFTLESVLVSTMASKLTALKRANRSIPSGIILRLFSDLEKLQCEASSVGRRIEEPISIFLVVTNAGSDDWKPTEED